MVGWLVCVCVFVCVCLFVCLFVMRVFKYQSRLIRELVDFPSLDKLENQLDAVSSNLLQCYDFDLGGVDQGGII